MLLLLCFAYVLLLFLFSWLGRWAGRFAATPWILLGHGILWLAGVARSWVTRSAGELLLTVLAGGLLLMASRRWVRGRLARRADGAAPAPTARSTRLF